LFLTEEQKAPLRDARVRAWVMKNKITPGAYEFMVARTAFFDAMVQEALGQGVPQLVFLGAGYDSRPYRFAQLLGGTRVYELDAAPTQRRKREMLEHAGVTVPVNVQFIPIDFDNDDLQQTLQRAGFAREKIALFLWEGVTYYLSRETVDRTLAAVKSVSAPGSCLAFDFASLSPDTLSEDAIKKLREQMSASRPAEPTRFGIPQGRVEPFLSARGFRIQELIDHEEMEARYLTLPDGSRIGKVPALFNLLVARAS
jgi:methyltransferase (TIGR00027 family)